MFSLSTPRRLCAPSFVRLSLVLTSLAATLLGGGLLGGASAQAPGYYTGPNLTGGHGTWQGANPPNPSYSTLNLQSGPLYGINVNGTSPSCGGQIEAQWIWTASNPNAPVPQQVIVKQYSSASWTSSTSSGQCDDALKDPAVTTPPSYPGGDTNSTSSGTHYSAVSADANGNLEVYCTPTASVAKGSCGVYYMATAYPIFLSIGGTLTDSNTHQPILDSSGNQQILVGQGCSAAITGIPSDTGWKTTYSWSVSGTTFQDWEPTTPGNQSANPPIPANSQASFYDPGPGTQTNPTYHWYWNDFSNATETVTCTATVTPPAGQGSSFSVTATQKVSVYVPTRSTNRNDIGDGRILNSTIIAEQTSAMMNNLEDFGSSWTTKISMPTTVAFGTGQWCYCQLITPGEYLTINGALQTSTDTTRGDGLDATFPYTSSNQDPGTEAADGNTYHSGDSPRLSGLNSNFDTVTLTDTLHTYVMFKPPAMTQDGFHCRKVVGIRISRHTFPPAAGLPFHRASRLALSILTTILFA